MDRAPVNAGTKQHRGPALQAPASREEGIRSPGRLTRLLEKGHRGLCSHQSGHAASRGSNKQLGDFRGPDTKGCFPQREAEAAGGWEFTQAWQRGVDPRDRCSSQNLPRKWTTWGSHTPLLAEPSPVAHLHFRGVASLREAPSPHLPQHMGPACTPIGHGSVAGSGLCLPCRARPSRGEGSGDAMGWGTEAQACEPLVDGQTRSHRRVLTHRACDTLKVCAIFGCWVWGDCYAGVRS